MISVKFMIGEAKKWFRNFSKMLRKNASSVPPWDNDWFLENIIWRGVGEFVQRCVLKTRILLVAPSIYEMHKTWPKISLCVRIKIKYSWIICTNQEIETFYQDTYSGFLLLLSLMSPSSASTEIRLGGVSSQSSLRAPSPISWEKLRPLLPFHLPALGPSQVSSSSICGVGHRVAGYGNVHYKLGREGTTDKIRHHSVDIKKN